MLITREMVLEAFNSLTQLRGNDYTYRGEQITYAKTDTSDACAIGWMLSLWGVDTARIEGKRINGAYRMLSVDIDSRALWLMAFIQREQDERMPYGVILEHAAFH